ncbi:MAG: tetratricopeptide (TPR) repeat protein [Maribacter sp.]|jgi:tetratricopeptide (TPR) repeat protein
MRLKTVYKSLLTLSVFAFIGNTTHAQCETWDGAANKDDLENTHMFYRDAIKAKNFAEAYPLWEKVYAAAPAADGNRASHYSDGRALIKEMYAAQTDATKQEKMLETFLGLYDKEYNCYPKDKKGKDKKAYLLENKAFELYYTFNYDRQVIFDLLEEASTATGKDLGYSVVYIYADVVVNFFLDKTLDADKARAIHTYLNEVCDNGIANSTQFKAYFQQQKDLANRKFDQIGGDIFGCTFHVAKIRPEYDANPDDKETYTRVYQTLEANGCTSDEALMTEIYAKMQKDRAAEEKRRQEEREKMKQDFLESNPAYIAQKAYKSGDYDTAVTKYKEAINVESDPSKKADYHYYLAVTYGRKLNKYSKAKEHIRKAASLDSSNGKPYNLLGDLYAKSARSCGKNTFEQRMVIIAAINKWSKAKSVSSDPDVQADAQKKINSYSGQLPNKEMVFLNGKEVGGSYRVGCWIGETVTIRVK